MVFLKSITFIVFVVLGSGCLAEEDVDSKEILEYVSRNILKASSDYGLRIEYCDRITFSSQTPKLDKEMLIASDVAREDAVTAVAFLQFRNYFLCEQEARLKLAFHLGIMESLKRELGLEIKSIENIQSTVSYPSKKELALEIKYFTLSEEVRDYFESVVGNKPFDLMATLKANELLR